MSVDEGKLKRDFTLEEYKSLRSEIMDSLTAQRNIKTICVGAIAAIYSFLFGRSPPLQWWAWIIPIFIAVFGLARAVALRLQMHIIASYLTIIEKRVNPPEGFWENYIRMERKKSIRASLTGLTSILAFLFLVAGTTLIFAAKYNGKI